MSALPMTLSCRRTLIYVHMLDVVTLQLSTDHEVSPDHVTLHPLLHHFLSIASILKLSSPGWPASWQGCFCPIFRSYSRQLETSGAICKTIYDLDATILIKWDNEECLCEEQ